MIGGVAGSETHPSDSSDHTASVAAVSDIGPRKVNEDRALATLSEDDGSWVIAVADGLGGHTRGDEAAQAAVEGLPRRIASRAEMVAMFAEADKRVLALTDPELRPRRMPLYMFPMSTLCVAAWTPQGGLLIGWMGDTLAFAATEGPAGFGGSCRGRPHRNPGGSIEICLGMPPGAAGLVHEPIEAEVQIITEVDPAAQPDAVVICSDGAWEPFVYKHGVEWLWDESAASGIGLACGPRRENADDIVKSVLAEARRLGLNDNATVAAALWR